jgi:hypothetical protein
VSAISACDLKILCKLAVKNRADEKGTGPIIAGTGFFDRYRRLSKKSQARNSIAI